MKINTPGFVYLIGPEALLHRPDVQMIKIGFSRFHPEGRRADLQCGSPVYLQMFAYFRATMSLEKALHDTFWDLREHGEWFRVEGKLRAFVGEFYDPPYEEVSRERLLTAICEHIVGETAPRGADLDEWRASADYRPILKWAKVHARITAPERG